MVDARALGDTASSKEFHGRVRLPEYEVATATGTVTTVGDLADLDLNVQSYSNRGFRRQCQSTQE